MAAIKGTPSGPTRLGYRMATGQGLPGTDSSSKTTPKYAKGGAVRAGGFKQAVVTSAARSVGNVNTTSVRHASGKRAPGFKKHAPKGV